MNIRSTLRWVGGIGTITVVGFVALVRAVISPDVGIGRREFRLEPIDRRIAARQEQVFDVIAEPYLDPESVRPTIRVLDRSFDMVLAEHFTPAKYGLSGKTVETVRFERPSRVTFRLARGPIAGAHETFTLHEVDGATELTYEGTLEADLWSCGQWWAKKVAPVWEGAVKASVERIAEEAERREIERSESRTD